MEIAQSQNTKAEFVDKAILSLEWRLTVRL